MRLFTTLVLVFVALSGWGQSGGSDPFSTKIWDDFSLHNLSSKGHRFLGYATVTLGAAAVLVKKLEDNAPGTASNAHKILGESAGIAAGTTVLAGLVAHFDKLSFSGELLTWHNLHALTALTGASVMASAALTGGSELHSKLGILGTCLMGLAIILEG